jgi:NDP-sugar pyrophosphorylase family protein/aminoglycoside/choline kinase family phosphotransferase
MNRPINIFIPAAGFGERLRPITLHIPKPLLPVLGRPVLQYVLERVSSLPIHKIAINLHHKKDIIESWIKQSSFNEKIELFPEEEILGTGGALKNDEEFLREGTFLVHNSDILSDIDLHGLLEHHLSSKNIVTLAVHDYPEFNHVIVDNKEFVKDVGTGLKPVPDGQILAFTGIAVYEPEFLNFLPDGASGVVSAWLKAVNAGHSIGTYNVTGCYWSDIGTPDAYAGTIFNILKTDGETVYIHPSVKGCENIEMRGYVVIEEGCTFENAGVIHELPLLKNCIFLPGSRVGAAHELARLENCILGAEFTIDLDRSAIFGRYDEDEGELIGAGGSDRKYYRIKRGNKTAVLMECGSNDPDFRRQIEYARFFLNHSIPVPELIEVDPDEKRAVFEDAGDTSLYNWLKCPREETQIEDIYRKIVDVLVLLHTSATDHVAACLPLKNRIFDYEYFRWETDYFSERFVQGVRHMIPDNISGLEADLNSLAFKADSFPKTIIHRDFQSHNIMVMADGSLQLIDYQGARMGPSAYDVASILWDPYYRLEENMRERLVDYYISKIEDKFDADYFRETLNVCRLQRHMQALGAYGFLSSVKGKKYFLKYVPEGLRLLKEDMSLLKDEYPDLHELIVKL